MDKAERIAVLLLDSAWTHSELNRIVTAVTRTKSEARSLPGTLLTALPSPPSRRVLVAYLKQTLRGREFRTRLIDKFMLAHRFKSVGMRSSIAIAADWDIFPLGDVHDLAELVGLPMSLVDWLATQRHPHYRLKLIRKRSNGLRLLEAPKQRLKATQRKIAMHILNAVPPHSASHGYTRRRSAITFVEPHINRPLVLRMDLSDFFASITANRVFGLFRSLGYSYAITQLLTNLCTTISPPDLIDSAINTTVETDQRSARPLRSALDRTTRLRLDNLYGQRHLPQGAPTSPALANLIAHRLDARLHALAGGAGVSYTRYADDLLFSGERNFGRSVKTFSTQVAAIALDEGFEVNFRKTRVMRQSIQQFAAGIVINERPNLQRDAYDELKAILHNCTQTGAEQQNRSGHSNFRLHLFGRIQWVMQLNPTRGVRLKRMFNEISWSD